MGKGGGGREEETENNLFLTEVKLLGKMASLLPFRGEDRARTSSNASKSLLRRVSAPPRSSDNNSISNNSHLLYESNVFSNQKRSLSSLRLLSGLQTLGIIIKIAKYKHVLEGSCRENNRRLVFD